MTRARPPAADDPRADDGQPRPGCADAGQDVTPLDIDDSNDTGNTGRPPPSRPIPSPGIPVTADRYERLKEQATTRRDRSDAPAQEDRPPGSTDN